MTSLHTASPAAAASPPVVIGATGGSGTRAFHAVLSALGLFMGERLNGAGDAMDMEPCLDRWINPLIGRHHRIDYEWQELGWWLRWRAGRDYRTALRQYRAECPAGQPWGWKNPRSMYVLPLIAACAPDFRFLHVVRDGRDMAYSDNQNQRRKHFEALFGDPATMDGDHDTPAASARLWATANGQAADWAERHLGPDRYLRIQLEELCAAPRATIDRMADWLRLSPDLADEPTRANAASLVSPPASLGRWRQAPVGELAPLTEAARPALMRFGYLDTR